MHFICRVLLKVLGERCFYSIFIQWPLAVRHCYRLRDQTTVSLSLVSSCFWGRSPGLRNKQLTVNEGLEVLGGAARVHPNGVQGQFNLQSPGRGAGRYGVAKESGVLHLVVPSNGASGQKRRESCSSLSLKLSQVLQRLDGVFPAPKELAN